MTERYEFVVEWCADRIPGSRYVATLGDYDLDAPTGIGSTAAEAIIDWLEMHSETLETDNGTR